MISVIMAAYNEERSISALLAGMPTRLLGHDIEVLVVDDGSSDGTADIARSFGSVVIRFDDNRGKGAAIRRGLESLHDSPCDAIVLMDADGQHDPAAIECLIDPILQGEADIVVGSRYTTTGRGSAPLNRYLVRTFTVAAIRRLLGVAVSDPYSGFRALAPDAARLLNIRGDRYECELEMIFYAHRSHLRVEERPIPMIYGTGTSKMGSRRGAFLGRISVLAGYTKTMVQEITGRQQANTSDKESLRA